MSILDTAFIFFLALIFFGPKKLPELARQAGKLLAEFRRASNDFKFQMEEELRMAEQADNQKKIDAIPASQPSALSGIIAASGDFSIKPPETGLPVGAATDPDRVEAPQFEGSNAAQQPTDVAQQPTGVAQQPTDLSSVLGPPSQSDAVNVEPPAVSGSATNGPAISPQIQSATSDSATFDSATTVSATTDGALTDPAVTERPDRRTSVLTTDAEENQEIQEVQSTNG